MLAAYILFSLGLIAFFQISVHESQDSVEFVSQSLHERNWEVLYIYRSRLLVLYRGIHKKRSLTEKHPSIISLLNHGIWYLYPSQLPSIISLGLWKKSLLCESATKMPAVIKSAGWPRTDYMFSHSTKDL